MTFDVVHPMDLTLARADLLSAVRAACSVAPTRRADGTWVGSYIDGHQVLGSPRGLACSVELMAAQLPGLGVQAVAGPISAGCALVSGLVIRSQQLGVALEGRFVRKTPKTYGRPGSVTGELPPGTRVALVDDVINSGQTALEALERLREIGADPVAMLVVVDRENGARDRLAQTGVELRSIFTLEELAIG